MPRRQPKRLVQEEISLSTGTTTNNKPKRLLVILVCLAFFGLVVVVGQYAEVMAPSRAKNTISISGVPSSSVHVTRQPRLGDGCFNVFLDVGSNIGVHTRFLYEPQKYPKAEVAYQAYREGFGGIAHDNRDFCSFGFEPNPAHAARHKQLEQVYHNVGWRYKFIHAAASDSDEGSLTFWHQADTAAEEWGFGTNKYGENSVAQQVPQVNLAKWIQYHIEERQPPTHVYGNYTYQQNNNTKNLGKVVMKMDIEGSEYSVLPSLLFSGVWCRVLDYVFGEPHPMHAMGLNRPGAPGTGQGEINFQSQEDASRWFSYLLARALKSVRPEDCKCLWVSLDDEAYLHDGMPFPENGTSNVAHFPHEANS